jgi:hypothetical protein
MRIDQRGGGRGGRGRLVVIQDDDFHGALAEPGNGLKGGGAAIHGYQEGSGELPEAVFQGIPAQAVALVEPVREVGVDGPAERPEDFEQQGGGGDAVDVVVAEDDDGLAALAGEEQALDGDGHVRQGERVGEVFEPGFEEGARGCRLAQAAVEEALGQEG